ETPEKILEYADSLIVPSSRLRYEGKDHSLQEIRENIKRQLEYISRNAHYEGMASDEVVRKAQYEVVTRELKLAIHAIEREPDESIRAEKRAKCTILLGFAGFHCGTQLIDTAEDIYYQFARGRKKTLRDGIDEELRDLGKMVTHEI